MNKWILNTIFPILTLMFLLLSCDKDYFLSCIECTKTEPVEVNIRVRLDPAIRPTEISVYEGNLEDGLLIKKQASALGEVEISVYKNKTYTLTATYNNINNRYYTTVDATTPRVRLERNRCDDPCYYVIDNKVDLRIRYTK
jgi:hypothetical protein